MAEIKDGILGGVSGKVGTVVGFSWRNKKLIRAKPTISKKPRTDKQLTQQTKLRYCTQLLTPIRKFVNKYIPASSNSQIGFEVLLSKLMKEMYIEQDEMFCIDYTQFYFALGILPTTLKTSIKFLKNGKLKVQWEDNSLQGIANSDDQLTVIALLQESHEFLLFEQLAKRQDGKTSFILPEDCVDNYIHFWFMWTNAADNLNSTSMYLGCLEIPVKKEE